MARQREQIMLCYPYDEGRLEKWLKETRYVYVQPKYEGDRCRAVTDPRGRCTLFSSSARELGSVPHINKAIENLNMPNMEFDGELYKHGMPHEEIRSRVSRTVGRHPNYEEIEYHIYDIVSQHEQVTRLNHLDAIVVTHPEWIKDNPLRKAPTFIANALEEVEARYERILDLGYEGIVLRHPRNIYKRARSTDMMKLKPRVSGIYEIVNAIEEYTIDGMPKKALGALILKDTEGNTFKVGTGFTRGQREDYWQVNLKGRWVKIRYQSCTVNGVPKMASFESLVQGPMEEIS